MTLTREDMTKYIKDNGYPSRVAEETARLAVEWLLNAIGNCGKDDRVELRGFGTFYVSEHGTRRAVHFRASAALKRLVGMGGKE